ncbi:MAG: TraR/DksA C4-type zinc finger protein [Candidatus Sumerlaeia bacterium]
MAIKKAPRKDPKPAKSAKAPARTAAKKAAPKKAAPKKVAPKKAAPKKAVKQAVKKAAPKKPAPKKAAAKKAVKPAKKQVAAKPAKKPVVAKPAPKKAAPKAAPKKPARPAAAEVRPAEKLASQLAAKRPVHKFIQDLIDRPTGMYNGILLAENPKPFPKKTPYSRKEVDKLREALTQERERLIHVLNSLQGVSRSVMDETREHPGYSQHLAEHATDLQTAEASMGLRTIEQEQLELVDEALERIQRNINHYGLCLACGNKIGIQRLIARPHAHLCMDCRQRYEKIRARRGL